MRGLLAVAQREIVEKRAALAAALPRSPAVSPSADTPRLDQETL